MMRLILVVLAVVLALSYGFVVVQQPSLVVRSSSTSLEMTILSFRGKKKNFPAGSPLSRACAQLGVPVKYSCKK